MKGFYKWCEATITMGECPHLKECLEAMHPLYPEVCYERKGEYFLYLKYERAEDGDYY